MSFVQHICQSSSVPPLCSTGESPHPFGRPSDMEREDGGAGWGFGIGG